MGRQIIAVSPGWSPIKLLVRWALKSIAFFKALMVFGEPVEPEVCRLTVREVSRNSV